MPQSESIAKLAEALSKAQADMQPARKDAENPYFNSKYADLASVWEAIRKPLSYNGLSVTQMPCEGLDGAVGINTLLMHSSGEWVSDKLTVKLSKNDPQAIGSCLTYLRRYALSAITGVATEDDDAEAATRPASQPSRAQEAQKPAQAAPRQAPAEAKPGDGSFIWAVGTQHKGKAIESLPDDYLEWFQKNGKREDHLIATDMELARREASMLPLSQDDGLDDAPTYDENGNPY